MPHVRRSWRTPTLRTQGRNPVLPLPQAHKHKGGGVGTGPPWSDAVTSEGRGPAPTLRRWEGTMKKVSML